MERGEVKTRQTAAKTERKRLQYTRPFVPPPSVALPSHYAPVPRWAEVIENRVLSDGLCLENRENVLIRGCTISNRDGQFGIALTYCRNVRIEHCIIRRVGNETMPEKAAKIKAGVEYAATAVAGIKLDGCKSVTIADTDITDCIGKGIYVTAKHWQDSANVVIEHCRIAYTYDDGILFAASGDQSDPSTYLPFLGAIIRNKVLHDIGLGLSRLPFARHGMYLKVRDALVEGNTVTNCFFGEGISLRNAGVVRGNKIRNCARACIAYWAQTNTENSSGVVCIENNDCRQDFSQPFPMRHIDDPARLHHLPLGGIVFSYSATPYTRLSRIILRGNRVYIGADYAGDAPLISGNGEQAKNGAVVEISGNVLTDLRTHPNYFGNLPEGISTSGNEKKTHRP